MVDSSSKNEVDDKSLGGGFTIIGTDGPDFLKGGEGVDRINGGAGDDDIVLGAGDGGLGGSGDDVFTFDPSVTGNDLIGIEGALDGLFGEPDDYANQDDGDKIDLRGLKDVEVVFNHPGYSPGRASYTNDAGQTVPVYFTNIEKVLTDEHPNGIDNTPIGSSPVVGEVLSGEATEDDGVLTANLLDNASDPDGDALHISNLFMRDDLGNDVAFTADEQGNVSIDTGQFDFLNDGEERVVTASYYVLDVNGASTKTHAQLIVTGITDDNGDNHAPDVHGDLRAVVLETDPIQNLDLLASASDPDGDELDISNLVVTDDLDGHDVAYTDLGNGKISIDPAQYSDLSDGETRNVTVTYVVTDGNGGETPTQGVFEVRGVSDAAANHAPTIGTELYAAVTEDDGVQTANLLVNASDKDGDAIHMANLVVSDGLGNYIDHQADAQGNISIDPGQFDFLNDGEERVVTASFYVEDSHGASTKTQAQLLVTGISDSDNPSANVIIGTEGDETITGTDGDDLINLLGGDDLVYASDGKDTINGGDGRDTVVYEGSVEDYTFYLNTDGNVIVVKPEGQGIDTLVDIEQGVFTDEPDMVHDVQQAIDDHLVM